MSELLNEIESYWTRRAEGYSLENHKELRGIQRQAWRKEILSHMPNKPKSEIRILDIGTGPGFFPVILAEEGYKVNAVDYTEEMLVQARMNAGYLIDNITFERMDAQNLEFEDETFDIVISRNLTWVLEEPEKAYSEWHRVLKKGGVLLNFDANWYTFLYDGEKKELTRQHHSKLKADGVYDSYYDGKGIDNDWMEDIARKTPLTTKQRPDWDKKVLSKLKFGSIYVDENLGERVLSREEILEYAITPIFKVAAIK